MPGAFTRYIFTTTYLMPGVGGLDKLQRRLAERNTSQECFVRRVLLQIFSEDENGMIKYHVDGMTGEVITCVHKFLPCSTLDDFQKDLEDLVGKTAQTWLKFQRSKIHFQATCDFDEEKAQIGRY